ncbi:MAG: exodeoxyribonuclease VII large subunit [Caldimicrobium sp.]
MKEMKIEKVYQETTKLPQEKFYYTVKEVSQKLKNLLEENLTFLWIEGEISNLKHSQNGHIYLNLVEDEATLKAIIFRDQKQEIPQEVLKNGLKVLVFGRLTFFGRSGEVFIIIKKIEPLGIGLLHLRKEYLLQKYNYLFDPNLKRELPPFPKKIGVITSLFGAALEDFLKVGLSRWQAHILIYPVKVQGEGALLEIIQAIKDLNEYFSNLDLIVITRGGGSAEDLLPFYTEEIILAVRNSRIPVVSAVGHEIDYTLCDLAADKRCPTPSAAAQEIFPDKKELLSKMELLRKKLYQLASLKISLLEGKIKGLQTGLQQRNPLLRLTHKERKLRDLKFQLFQIINEKLLIRERALSQLKKQLDLKHPSKLLEIKEEKLKGLKKILFSLSPYNVLKRGYSIVKTYPQGEIVKSSEKIKPGDQLEIILSQGKLLVRVIEVEEKNEL